MPSIEGQRLPSTLYHYTDIYGLQGIYEKGELWATNGLYLNDTSELSLGLLAVTLEIQRRRIALLERINRRLRAGEGLGPNPELGELDILYDIVEGSRHYSQCYVISLSAKHDQLSQWRAYAKDGYCIGFATAELKKCLTEDQYIGRVQYGDKSTDLHAKKIVRFSRALWRASADWDFDDDLRKFIVMSQIVKEAAFVKDSNFVEEKEVRIIEANATPNHFTASQRFGMTPRKKIPINEKCITSVTVGPGAHKDLRTRSLFWYFGQTPFMKDSSSKRVPEVKGSVIPYRDW